MNDSRLSFFFFNDPAPTEISPLSLHDALPISGRRGCRDRRRSRRRRPQSPPSRSAHKRRQKDRKSTRLNSSHSQISYAVFCLKKKKPTNEQRRICTT